MARDAGYELKDLNVERNTTGFMVPHVTLGQTLREALKGVTGYVRCS